MLRSVAAATREAFGDSFLEAAASGGAAAALAARQDRLSALRELVDRVQLSDFGGGVLGAPGDASSPRAVTYQHVGAGPAFSMGVFVIPPKGAIPLHSHPEMCVFSKLLYGDLRVRCFDFEDDHAAAVAAMRAGGEARAAVSERLLRAGADAAAESEAASSTVMPEVGNLHEFSSPSGCAVFDVIAPPYDDDAGRSCICECSNGRLGLRDSDGRPYSNRLPAGPESRRL